MKVGVLGGGQLGRMLALSGYPLGLSFRFFDPGPAEAIQGIGQHVRAAYDDREALERFTHDLHVATYEFENVPLESARFVSERVPLLPGVEPLQVGQDRLAEKRLFRVLDIPTPEFTCVETRSELAGAVELIGLPAVLKTRRQGYDGKGQRVLLSSADLEPAWDALGARDLVLEEWIELDRELSIIAVRTLEGSVHHYPLAENDHEDGILRRTVAPAKMSDSASLLLAKGYVDHLVRHLKYVGVFALELFQSKGKLLANEFAPRVHNSGHWTQDGSETSQFENHLRAICGFPLGPIRALGRTTMTNLIGSAPGAAALLRTEGARVHLYGKRPKPGRKLGHINVVDRETAAGESRG